MWVKGVLSREKGKRMEERLQHEWGSSAPKKTEQESEVETDTLTNNILQRSTEQ